ncbi:MAG TPA: hypothetical protein VF296_02715 [Gallionella sp.]|jgi:hypothetical protein
MSSTNEVRTEKFYKTRMSAGKQGSPEGGKISEQRHTRGEIISRAEEVLAKELSQNLATFAGLEEKATLGPVGEDTVWGYVNKSGNKIEFTDELKLKAAIDVLNLNGHFFEATPIS